jgi:hypothetical protein
MREIKRGRRKQTGKKYRHMAASMIIVIAAVFLLYFKTSAVAANADTPERYKYYTSVYINRDDTLWDISKEYMTSDYQDIRAYIDEVVSINHLESDEVQYGTTICVPYYSDELK